jgi:hypothetical protein
MMIRGAHAPSRVMPVRLGLAAPSPQSPFQIKFVIAGARSPAPQGRVRYQN